MSATAVWEPVSSRREFECNYVSDHARKIGIPKTFSLSDIDYLRGAADNGNPLAEEIIDLLHKGGPIRVWLEY